MPQKGGELMMMARTRGSNTRVAYVQPLSAAPTDDTDINPPPLQKRMSDGASEVGTRKKTRIMTPGEALASCSPSTVPIAQINGLARIADVHAHLDPTSHTPPAPSTLTTQPSSTVITHQPPTLDGVVSHSHRYPDPKSRVETETRASTRNNGRAPTILGAASDTERGLGVDGQDQGLHSATKAESSVLHKCYESQQDPPQQHIHPQPTPCPPSSLHDTEYGGHAPRSTTAGIARAPSRAPTSKGRPGARYQLPQNVERHTEKQNDIHEGLVDAVYLTERYRHLYQTQYLQSRPYKHRYHAARSQDLYSSSRAPSVEGDPDLHFPITRPSPLRYATGEMEGQPRYQHLQDRRAVMNEKTRGSSLMVHPSQIFAARGAESLYMEGPRFSRYLEEPWYSNLDYSRHMNHSGHPHYMESAIGCHHLAEFDDWYQCQRLVEGPPPRYYQGLMPVDAARMAVDVGAPRYIPRWHARPVWVPYIEDAGLACYADDWRPPRDREDEGPSYYTGDPGHSGFSEDPSHSRFPENPDHSRYINGEGPPRTRYMEARPIMDENDQKV